MSNDTSIKEGHPRYNFMKHRLEDLENVVYPPTDTIPASVIDSNSLTTLDSLSSISLLKKRFVMVF
jgi:hypothetical protein